MRRVKVGKLGRKVVRYFSIVPRFCSCGVRVFGRLRLDLEQEEDGHGDHGEAQHITRGDAQHTVHFAAGRHLGELPTTECVADEEADEEEQADSQLPQRGGEERRREEHGRKGASDGDEPQEEVEPMSGFAPDEDNEGAFARAAVVVDVANVVHHQQGVDHRAHAETEQERGERDFAREGEEGADDRHKAEKEEDEEVAHGAAAEVGGVEEGAGDARHACRQESDEEVQGRDRKGAQQDGRESEPREGGQRKHHHDAPRHGARRDPPLSASAFGAETIVAVGTAAEVDEVVDEVGGDLHERGEEGAEQCGDKGTTVEHDEDFTVRSDESQGGAGDHRNQGAGEGFGAGGQPPHAQGTGMRSCIHKWGEVSRFAWFDQKKTVLLLDRCTAFAVTECT